MIKFSLKCENGHSFESWFASSDKFEQMCVAKQVECPFCTSHKITKSLMAPAISPNTKAPLRKSDNDTDVKSYLDENSEDVGKRFVKEARAIHAGEAPERQIHGEAKIEDAKALIEEGVPVLPLPIPPKSKTN